MSRPSPRALTPPGAGQSAIIAAMGDWSRIPPTGHGRPEPASMRSIRRAGPTGAPASCSTRSRTSISPSRQLRCRMTFRNGLPMSQPPDLIGPQPLVITPAAGMTGPRLWVRRLVIWKEPGGEKIREIELRPGLNIIWSPDGADDASGGQNDAIGHGSGKTLFCRLIRYCLGEDRFATETQRERIGVAFPNGIVGAEVMLDGVCWAIVRPL